MVARGLGLLTGGVRFTSMPTELATERFVLTRQELADAAWLAELFTARGGGTVTEGEARARVAAMHDLTSAHSIGAYVLRPRDGSAPAGYVAIIIGRGTVEEPEIAYELLPAARGHGYAPRSGQRRAVGRVRHGPQTGLGDHPALERSIIAGPRQARRLPPDTHHARRARTTALVRMRKTSQLILNDDHRCGRTEPPSARHVWMFGLKRAVPVESLLVLLGGGSQCRYVSSVMP